MFPFLFAKPAAAQCTTEWLSAVDGNWSEDDKWTDGVPDAADNACLMASGTYTVTLDVNASVNTLTLGGPGGTQTLLMVGLNRTLTLGASSFVEENGVFDWQQGSLFGTDLTNEGLIRVNGAGAKTLDGPFTLFNNNLLTVAGTGQFALRDNAVLTTAGGGVFDVLDDASIASASSGGDLIIVGTLRKSAGAGLTTFSTGVDVIVNGGLIDVQSGSVDINAGTFTDAALNADEGTILQFRSSTTKIFDGLISGSPTGTISWAGDVRSSVSGAILDFAGTGLNWVSGNILNDGANPASFTNRGLLNISGPAAKTIFAGSVLANEGSVSYTGPGLLVMRDNSIIRNVAGGLFELLDDTNLSSSAGGGTFENSGTLRKSAGAGTTIIFSGFRIQNESAGLIDAAVGTLRIDFLDHQPGALLQGAATFDAPTVGNFHDNGTLGPGDSPGILTYIGTYAPDSPATVLDIELGGLTPGTGHDQLSITGAATLGGVLDVSLVPGFTPVIGNSFVVLTATGGVNGEFDSVSPPPGVTLDVQIHPNDVTVLVTNVVQLAADLAVTKVVDNAAPTVGDVVTFTVTATNNGPDASTGVKLSDIAPAGLVFGAVAPSAGSFNANTGAWTIGALANGASETLTVDATVTQEGLLTNTASITASDQSDAVPGNNSASSNVNAVAAPEVADLAVTKIVDNAAPTVGAVVTFTVTVTNNGPDPATGISVSDLAPAGLTFGAVSASAGIYNSNTGLWTVESLAIGASAMLTVPATPTLEGLLTNTASVVAADQGDPAVVNNLASAEVIAMAAVSLADVSVWQSVETKKPKVGETVVFTVELWNNGPDLSTGVKVQITPPPNGAIVSVTPISGSYDGNLDLWSAEILPPTGEKHRLDITVRAIQAGELRNIVQVVAADQADPDLSNNMHTMITDALPVVTACVTTLAESGPGSLRQCILDASSGDAIGFAVTGTIHLAGQQIEIDKSLTIEGPGRSALTIHGSGASRVFRIAGQVVVTISGMTLQDGKLLPAAVGSYVYGAGLVIEAGGVLLLDDVSVREHDCSIRCLGAGISVVDGELHVTNSTIRGNEAEEESDGGAIWAGNSTIVTIRESEISDNSVFGNGGGVWTDNAGTTITNSTISRNSAGLDGGGIYSRQSASIRGSFVRNNDAQNGGGIYFGKEGQIDDTEITGNKARMDPVSCQLGSGLGARTVCGQGGGVYSNRDGSLEIRQSLIDENSASVSGGGVYGSNLSSFLLERSTITRNLLRSGIGYPRGGAGMFIVSARFPTAFQISESQISNNRCLGTDVGGGAIVNGPVRISGTTISENECGLAGGISIDSGTIIDSDISNNIANTAGGIASSGFVSIQNSTIRNNEATISSGGGIFFGISGELEVTSSTISGNQTAEYGGGIYLNRIQRSVGLVLENTTITNNQAALAGGGLVAPSVGIARYKNSIIAGNSADAELGFVAADCWRRPGYGSTKGFVSDGHNILGSGTGCDNSGSNDVVVPVSTVFGSILGPLADNGGPTLTHALLDHAANVAIDRGSCIGETTDQRGLQRPVDQPEFQNGDNGCDIGAVELQVASPPVQADLRLASSVNSVAPTVGAQFTVTLALQNDGPAAASGVTVLSVVPAGLVFESATPTTGTYSATTGVWTVGNLTTSGGHALLLRFRAESPGPVAHLAEISASDQLDPDSIPGNGNPNEDDRGVVSVNVQPVQASYDYVVTSSRDDPDLVPGDGLCLSTAVVCTLRAAIEEANASGGGSIGFNIFVPGGKNGTSSLNASSACDAGSTSYPTAIIRLGTGLPNLTSPLSIDGCSQPGTRLVRLDGAVTGLENPGLRILSPGVQIRGLILTGFLGTGILVEADGAVIDYNYIGTDPSGTQELGNGDGGVVILNANNTQIGTSESGNVIAGNSGAGISIMNSSGNQIVGNFIGTDKSANILGNADNGITLENAPLNSIGANIIAYNGGNGVEIGGASSTGNGLESNVIGIALVEPDITTPTAPVVLADAGNGKSGVFIGNDALGTTIGGAAVSSGNLIGANQQAQVSYAGPGNIGGFIDIQPFTYYAQNLSFVSIGNLVLSKAGKTSGDSTGHGAQLRSDMNARIREVIGRNFSIRPATEHRAEKSEAAGGVGLHIEGGFINVGRAGEGNLFIGFEDAAIEVEDASDFQISDNIVIDSGVGVRGVNAENVIIVGNSFTNNCAAIEMNSSNVSVVTNEIGASTCESGAIRYEASSGTIEGNLLSENAGDAIFLMLGSNPVVTENNISANTGFGLRNDDPLMNVAAGANWWGDVSGPGGAGPGSGDAVSLGTVITDWLPGPIALFVSAATDLRDVQENSADTLTIYVQNWLDFEDEIEVTALDEEGWIAAPGAWIVNVDGFEGAELQIPLIIPAGSDGAQSTVNITARSVFFVGLVATSDVILRSTDLTVTDREQADFSELSKELVLHQNYPNPFRSSTRMTFSMPQSGTARLAVYDALGRQVRLLIDEHLSAGRYETEFQAGDLPSGIYFSRLETQTGAFVQKMIRID